MDRKQSRYKRLVRSRFQLRRLARRGGRPRLVVFRSSKHVYAQLIDDTAGGAVLAHASSLEKGTSLKKGCNKDAASHVGRTLAQRALRDGVRAVIFDRSGYLYHGRVKALAEAAREEGLEF